MEAPSRSKLDGAVFLYGGGNVVRTLMAAIALIPLSAGLLGSLTLFFYFLLCPGLKVQSELSLMPGLKKFSICAAVGIALAGAFSLYRLLTISSAKLEWLFMMLLEYLDSLVMIRGIFVILVITLAGVLYSSITSFVYAGHIIIQVKHRVRPHTTEVEILLAATVVCLLSTYSIV